MDPTVWRRRSNGQYVRRSEADIAARQAAAALALRTTGAPAPAPVTGDALVSAAYGKYSARWVEATPEVEEGGAEPPPIRSGPHRATVYRSRSGKYVSVNSDSDDDVADAKRSAAAQRAAAAEAERRARERAEEVEAAARADRDAAEAAAQAAEASARSASERAAAAKAAAAARLLALAANAAGPPAATPRRVLAPSKPPPASHPPRSSPAFAQSDRKAKASFSTALSAGCAAMNPVAAVSALVSAPPEERGALLLAMPPFTAAAALFKLDKGNRERAISSVAAAVAAADGAFARQHVLLKDHLSAFFGGGAYVDGLEGGGAKPAVAGGAASAPAAPEELLPPHFDTLLETAVLAIAAVQDAIPPPAGAGEAPQEAAQSLLDSVRGKAAGLASACKSLQSAVASAQSSHSDWRRLRALEQRIAPPAAPQLPNALALAPKPVPAAAAADPFDLATLVNASRARILSRATPAAAVMFSPPPPASPPAAAAPSAASFASPAAMATDAPQFEWVRTPQGSWARQAAPPPHLAVRHPHLAVIAKKQLDERFGHETVGKLAAKA